MGRLLLVILVFIVPVSTLAIVYKCVDENGNVTFSDYPCADDAVKMKGYGGDVQEQEDTPRQDTMDDKVDRARPRGDIDQMAAESLKLYNEKESIRAQMQSASAEVRDRIKKINSLKKKEKDPEKIKKYDEELKQLNSKKKEAERPFRKKLNQLVIDSRDKNQLFTEAMKPYCLVPGKYYAGTEPSSTMATFHSAFISYEWKGPDGKKTAWAHLRLRKKPNIPSGARMLDNTYYISSNSDNSIWVWAGHFHIAFIIEKEAWKGKDQVKNAVKHFVDLKGLSEIHAE